MHRLARLATVPPRLAREQASHAIGVAMYTLARLCPEEDILLELPVCNRAQLFERVALHLQQRYGLAAEPIARLLAEREVLGSTALGHGVALPHARVPGLSTPLAVLVRPSEPIEFAAPDGRPVSEAIVLLVPQHANAAHLQLLAEAAQRFCSRPFRQALRRAQAPAAVRRLLLEPLALAA